MGKKVGPDHTRSSETMPSNVVMTNRMSSKGFIWREGVEEWKTSGTLGDQLGIVTLVLTAT